MAKISEELAKQRGENVKSLLKRYGWTQRHLAEKLGISEPVLNAKLNCKGRSLNEGDIDEIKKLFPFIERDWLLGISRYPNTVSGLTDSVSRANNEGILLNTGLIAFATLNGYSVTMPDFSEINAVDTALAALKAGYTISKDGSSVSLSLFEFRRLQNKIADHIKLELDYLFDKED